MKRMAAMRAAAAASRLPVGRPVWAVLEGDPKVLDFNGLDRAE